jgi:hypothetical protein
MFVVAIVGLQASPGIALERLDIEIQGTRSG